MNKKAALEQLINALSGFEVHPRFLREMSDLLKGTLAGKERPFFELLRWQLTNVINFGVAVDSVDGNERLKGADGRFYSIHIHGAQFNVRLIVHISDSENPMLLCAFSEKSGKRHTDYSQYTSLMDDRYNDLKGGETNE